MCVHIYYAYSILSNLHENLATLVKIKLGFSYSSSYTQKTHTQKVLTCICLQTQILTQKYNHYVLHIDIFKYSQSRKQRFAKKCHL